MVSAMKFIIGYYWASPPMMVCKNPACGADDSRYCTMTALAVLQKTFSRMVIFVVLPRMSAGKMLTPSMPR